MGGPGAPDDLRLGHLTQEWLATSDDPQTGTSGGYWHHQRRAEPAPSVRDQPFQDQLLEELARFTAIHLAWARLEMRHSARSTVAVKSWLWRWIASIALSNSPIWTMPLKNGASLS
jgi:hypothetical protein